MFDDPEDGLKSMKGYVGSVSVDRSGEVAVATSPRGGNAYFWQVSSGRPLGTIHEDDICGAACSLHHHQFLLTTGQGRILLVEANKSSPRIVQTNKENVRFDNHCRIILGLKRHVLGAE